MKKSIYNNHTLHQLLIIGILVGFSSLVFFIMFITSSEAIDKTNLTLGIIGSIFGFLLSAKSGGVIVFGQTTHERTPEQIEIDHFIRKYQSSNLQIVPALLFMLTELYIALPKHYSYVKFDINSLLYALIFSFLIVVLACGCVKYISAWFNMKKIMKQEK